MSSKVRTSRLLFSISATLALIAVPIAALADNFDEGIKYYTKRDWPRAAAYFDAAVKDTPWDAKVLYYAAVAHQYNRDFKAATALYKKIVDKFPGTEAYTNSVTALKVLDPKFLQSKASESASPSAPSASASSSSTDSLAGANFAMATNECNIPLTQHNGVKMLDATVNGRRAQFEFSGDESVMSAKDAVALGLAPSSAPPAAGAKLKASLSVGQVSASGYPITIMQTEHPKLGGDFFSKFAFSLDSSAIHVTKKGSGSQSTANDVPFRKVGKNLMIRVTVNGRNVEVAFDPDGGENVVPKNRAREFGLDVQESTTMNKFVNGFQAGPLPGQPGYGDLITKSTAQAKIVCGPVNTSEVTFRCEDNVKEPKVGPSIFGSWKYDIDQSSKVIHFHR